MKPEQIQKIAAAALNQAEYLVKRMFPNGEQRGKEYVIGDLSGSKGDSLSINLETGVWKDFARPSDSGADLINLWAAWRNCKQSEAAQDVADVLGINVDDPLPPPASKSKTSNFQAIMPVPSDAPPYPFKSNEKVWTYLDAQGQTLHYVKRIETREKSKKTFIPITYGILNGVTGWHEKHPPKPKPLYGLYDLAKRPNDPVLIVEGEKCCDAARNILYGFVVVTSSGGSGAVRYADWSPLKGRDVTIWPDADAPGKKYAETIREILGPQTKIVTIPQSAPEGWDIADAIEEGWTADRIQALIDLATEKQPLSPDTISRDPFTPLGYNRATYFYLCHATGEVHALHARSHKKECFLALAPLSYWEAAYPGAQGPSWTIAANALIRACEVKGMFDPDAVRGRGAWWDNGRVVVHLGNCLLINNTQCGLQDIETRYCYESAIPFHIKITSPLDDAMNLLEISKMFRWQSELSAYLLAGWTVIAPICGALDWRPHIWITGTSGSGKTWILTEYVHRLVGPMSLYVKSETTEAGLRQRLRTDALPVLFDEAEADETNDLSRIHNVLGLMRQASSENAGKIIKGTQSGFHQSFSIRSCFALASISISAHKQSDQSRICILPLSSPSILNKEHEGKQFAAIRSAINQWPENIGDQLFQRTIRLVPIIRKNISVFTVVAAEVLGIQRIGDQVGTLLAGAWSLVSDQEIDSNTAQTFIQFEDWEEHTESMTVLDEERCLTYLLETVVQIESDRGLKRRTERTIGELIALAARRYVDEDISPEAAEKELRRFGIRTEDETILIANQSQRLHTIFQRTHWTDWGRVLRRLPSTGTRQNGVRFTSGVIQRVTEIPFSLVLDDTYEQKTMFD